MKKSSKLNEKQEKKPETRLIKNLLNLKKKRGEKPIIYIVYDTL